MCRLLTMLTLFLSFAVFFSCKKSNSSINGGGSVRGNWNFVYLKAQTNATVSSNGSSNVTKSEYTSMNGSGTIDFTADSVIVTNLSYTISGMEWFYVYVGNTLLDSVSTPLSGPIPAYDEAATYQQIGNDSLYFPAGSFSTTGIAGTTQVNGARYVFKNDTLEITEQLTVTQSGVNTTVSSASETIYLLKQ